MNVHNSFIPAFRLQIARPYFVEFGGMGNLSVKKRTVSFRPLTEHTEL